MPENIETHTLTSPYFECCQQSHYDGISDIEIVCTLILQINKQFGSRGTVLCIWNHAPVIAYLTIYLDN